MCTLCAFVCVPVFSSISLDLLPERAATLMVYEDDVEIVSGLQGECSVYMWILYYIYNVMYDTFRTYIIYLLA